MADEETEKTEEKKETTERYVVEKVATQTADVIHCTETNKDFNVELALAEILNKQEKLIKLMK